MFVTENLKQYAALKAMGLTNGRLIGMAVLQATIVGAIGWRRNAQRSAEGRLEEAQARRCWSGSSRRGLAAERLRLSFLRIEPLLVPKRSSTGASGERVDTRALRVIYALPPGTTNAYPGQQADVFIEGIPVGQAEVTSSTNAGETK